MLDDPIDEFTMWYLQPSPVHDYYHIMRGGIPSGMCSRLDLIDNPRCDFERSLPIIDGGTPF